ncbi:unnamed protein product [Acanthosepion pharaonis]|uniref:Uncharacterized protein n=1 Tax=Acanthosepion pharaonis TaxID=158019 RepID=A0A812DD31_ACAPH|nr:unnamed protein product [Sepia pharaonis]
MFYSFFLLICFFPRFNLVAICVYHFSSGHGKSICQFSHGSVLSLFVQVVTWLPPLPAPHVPLHFFVPFSLPTFPSVSGDVLTASAGSVSGGVLTASAGSVSGGDLVGSVLTGDNTASVGSVSGGDLTASVGSVSGGDLTASVGSVSGGDLTASVGSVSRRSQCQRRLMSGGDLTASVGSVSGGDLTASVGSVSGGDLTASVTPLSPDALMCNFLPLSHAVNDFDRYSTLSFFYILFLFSLPLSNTFPSRFSH